MLENSPVDVTFEGSYPRLKSLLYLDSVNLTIK